MVKMGKSNVGGKYVPVSMKILQKNLFKTIAFLSKTPDKRAKCFSKELKKEKRERNFLK